MHLWPSLRIRESFKKSYLSKVEWNLHRMKQQQQTQSQSQSQTQTLLEKNPSSSSSSFLTSVVDCSRDAVFILSCCFCCFCCGACHDGEEK